MASRLKVIKGALRSCENGPYHQVLLELNAFIDQQPQSWTARYARAQVNSHLGRYALSIHDYSFVLEQNLVNTRNRIRVLQGISSSASRLSNAQKAELREVFAKAFSHNKFAATTPAVKATPGSKAAAVGRIAQISKFLLDNRDIAKIEQLVSFPAIVDGPKVHRLTLERSEKLTKVLRKIDSRPGVIGSCIVGADGFVLASTLPIDIDTDAIVVGAMGVYLTTNNTSKKIGHQHVRQIVIRSAHGHMLISDYSGGTLITLCEEQDTSTLAKLMRKITKLADQAATTT